MKFLSWFWFITEYHNTQLELVYFFSISLKGYFHDPSVHQALATLPRMRVPTTWGGEGRSRPFRVFVPSLSYSFIYFPTLGFWLYGITKGKNVSHIYVSGHRDVCQQLLSSHSQTYKGIISTLRNIIMYKKELKINNLYTS